MSSPNPSLLPAAPPGPQPPHLGDFPPRGGLTDRAPIGAIAAWLASSSKPGLWVHGPAGSGRTTALAAAIRRHVDREPGARELRVKRVVSFSGMSVEEMLEDVAPFFRQAGIPTLEAVLGQRAFLHAKILILMQAIRSGSFLLWIDDINLILANGGAIDAFIQGVRLLQDTGGRLAIVSESLPPAAVADCFEVVEVEWAGSAVAQTLRLETPAEEAVDQALSPILEKLSPDALATLFALSVLSPEPSRRAIDAAAQALGVELDLQAASPDPRLLELQAHGLVDLPPANHALPGSPVTVISPVRRAARTRLEKRDGTAWKALHVAIAAYHLRVAGRTGEPWHFVRAWRAFLGAGNSEGAYETQKLFLESLIQRGSMDLARHVLEETIGSVEGPRRAVALGNLAIIHKNLGEHGRALEIYQRIHEEFENLGDQINAARVLHQIGNTQYGMGRLQDALDSYEQSLEISTALGERTVAVATRIQIANVYYLHGDRSSALERYLETLDDAHATSDRGLAAAVELQIGQIHLLEKRYVEADQHLRQAEASSRECGDWRGLVKVLEAQGLVAEERREYDLARTKLDEAVRTALSLGDPGEAVTAWLLVGRLEEKRLQLAEALKCYLSAEELVGRIQAQSSQGAKAHVDAVKERLDALAATLGEEAYARLRRGAGK